MIILQFSNLNWLSILTATVVYFMLGYLWYVVLFSKPYQKSLGKENEILASKAIFMIGPAICCLIYTIASALLMQLLAISTWTATIEFTLIIGIGFLVSNTFNIAINPNIPQPLLYGLVTGTYHLVSFFIANTILVLMK